VDRRVRGLERRLRFFGSFDQLAVVESGAGSDQGDQVGCVHGPAAVLADSMSLNAIAMPAAREPVPLVTRDLAAEHLTVPTDKGADAGLKVSSLVAGMVAGADSIDDKGLLRHGGMGRLFARAHAPSTLGSFQLDGPG